MKIFHASVPDVRIGEVEFLELREGFEVFRAGIGNCRPRKVQLSELQPSKAFQARAADGGLPKVKDPELGKALEVLQFVVVNP
ncbi:MAG: hypothetical protein ABR915_02610 [Thermoguttaceae bacterium]